MHWLAFTRRAEQLRHGLRRDAVRQESGDVDRQVELCRIMWWMRHAVLTASLAAAVADGRWSSADVLAVSALALDVLNHRLVVVRPRLVSRVIVLDALALVVLAWCGLPAAVVLVLAVALLSWAATFRPAAAIAAYVGASLSAWTAFARGERLRPSIPMGAFALLGAIFLVRMIRLNMGARQAAEREHIVAEGVDAVIWEAMAGPVVRLRVSPAAERLLGHPAASFETPGFVMTLVHPDDLGIAHDIWTGAVATSVQIRLRRRDGEYRWFENHTSFIGQPVAGTELMVGVLVDRTSQVAVERNALTLGHLMSSSPIGQIMLCRRNDQPIVEALNAACQRALGIVGDPIGRPFNEVIEPRMVDVLLALLDEPGVDLAVELTGADGRVYEATGRHLDDDSCSVDLLDVTERVEHRQRLHEQVRRDDLTGLVNRRGLLETIEARLADADGAVSLLLLDLDDFKEVNDSLGHATGDQLLREVAHRLSAGASADHTPARLGGDEFAVLVPGLDGAAAAVLAARIRAIVNEPVEIGELRLRVRASVGVAAFPADAADAAELVRRADVAMYTAKHRGRGVERYDADADPFDRDRVALAGELEDAIEGDQLVLHHQPVLDLSTDRVVGTEALVRWRHPRLGFVPPDRFIELAEISGLIRPLTRWVVRRALMDVATMDLVDDDPFEVSVNLSVRNLYERDLVDWFRRTLDELGVPPHRLVVEITESTIMDDQAIAIEVLEGLRALGVRTWIDDFGTGHSSFARLRSLPVDGVKIDRSFVSDVANSASDRILLRSIIELVRSLGLVSIAEGVEDLEHLALLRTNGCDLAQGYHIARPMPFAELRTYLGRAADHVAA